MKLDMTIWDNTTTKEEKQEILLYCEHALLKACREQLGEMPKIEITRFWYGFSANIDTKEIWTGWTDEWKHKLIRKYNHKLNHLAYWRKLDDNGEELLVMDVEW